MTAINPFYCTSEAHSRCYDLNPGRLDFDQSDALRYKGNWGDITQLPFSNAIAEV